MADFQSYINKVRDIGFKTGSFKNDSGENVEYEQLIIKVEVDNDIEEIVLSGGNAPKPRSLKLMLKGATTHGDFLGEGK